MMLRILKITLISALLTAIGCNKFGSKPEPVFIGEYGSFTGSESTFGINTHRGVMLAVDEQNAKGGVNGRPIEVLTKDNGSDEARVAPGVRELIANEKVLALIGEVVTNRSMAAAPLAQAAGIPMVSSSSTHPKVTQVGDYIFRACFIDPFQGYVMAKFARETLKISKVAILTEETSDYSLGLSKNFKETFTGLGGTITVEKFYKSGDRDFRKQLQPIKATQPEALFIPGYYADTGLISRQVRQLGIRAFLMGGDGWNSSKLIEIGRDAVNGAYFTRAFFKESSEPFVKDFVNRYREKWGEDPDGPAALAYDTGRMIINALLTAPELTRKAVRDQISKTKNFPGVTGNITMTPDRNPLKPAIVMRVDGNTFRYVTTVNPAETP